VRHYNYLLLLYIYIYIKFNKLCILFSAKSVCGFDIKIGVSFASVLKRNVISSMEMEFLLKFFEDRKYLITIDIETRNIFIILKKNAQPADVLEAYFYASMCGLYICMARMIPVVSNERRFTPSIINAQLELSFNILILFRIYC